MSFEAPKDVRERGFVCAVCHEPVNPSDPATRRRVHGWERPRRAGGTNAIELRTVEDGVFACDLCIRRMKSGMPAEQGGMF